MQCSHLVAYHLYKGNNEKGSSIDDSSERTMTVEIVLSGELFPVLSTESVKILRQEHQKANVEKKNRLYGGVLSGQNHNQEQ